LLVVVINSPGYRIFDLVDHDPGWRWPECNGVCIIGIYSD
jgi:hypothetical protein